MSRLRLSEESIRAVLEEGGWPCNRISEGTFRSLFTGRHSSFPFYVRIDPAGYLVLAIVPFLRSPKDDAQAATLYARLLELNHQLLMAKFSIDDDLDVVLSVEYPSAEIDRSEIDDALDVLSYYADRHYDELRALAGSARAATPSDPSPSG